MWKRQSDSHHEGGEFTSTWSLGHTQPGTFNVRQPLQIIPTGKLYIYLYNKYHQYSFRTDYWHYLTLFCSNLGIKTTIYICFGVCCCKKHVPYRNGKSMMCFTRSVGPRRVRDSSVVRRHSMSWSVDPEAVAIRRVRDVLLIYHGVF